MGMFDDITRFDESFKEGELFTLEDAKIGPPIETDYGTDRPVQLKIGGKWFSIFGQAMSNQVDRMERGDLPAEVAIVRRPTRDNKREMKLIVTREQMESGEAQEPIPF